MDERRITRDVNHVYAFDGVTYPSVTTFLKILDKSGPLMAWASRMTAEAAIDMGEGLSTLLSVSGREGAVKALTARSAWKNEEARDLGTDVHAMAELVALGKPLPEMADATRERVAHYAAWWKASGWRIRAVEALVVNPDAGYGGTLDLLCYDREGRTVLADIKTGKGVYDETALQLAAYGWATWLDNGQQLYRMPQVDRYAVIHVTTETAREVEMSVGRGEYEAFRAAMTLSGWRNSTKAARR